MVAIVGPLLGVKDETMTLRGSRSGSRDQSSFACLLFFGVCFILNLAVSNLSHLPTSRVTNARRAEILARWRSSI